MIGSGLFFFIQVWPGQAVTGSVDCLVLHCTDKGKNHLTPGLTPNAFRMFPSLNTQHNWQSFFIYTECCSCRACLHHPPVAEHCLSSSELRHDGGAARRRAVQGVSKSSSRRSTEWRKGWEVRGAPSRDSRIPASQRLFLSFRRWRRCVCILLCESFMDVAVVDMEEKGLQVCHGVLNGSERFYKAASLCPRFAYWRKAWSSTELLGEEQLWHTKHAEKEQGRQRPALLMFACHGNCLRDWL